MFLSDGCTNVVLGEKVRFRDRLDKMILKGQTSPLRKEEVVKMGICEIRRRCS